MTEKKTLKEVIAASPNLVDVTAQNLGTSVALIPADGLRKTRPRPPAGARDVTSEGIGMTFIGAEAFRPKAKDQKPKP